MPDVQEPTPGSQQTVQVAAGICGNECQPGFYMNAALSRCSACSTGCKTCISGLTTGCTSCNDNFFLSGGVSCVSACPSPKMGDIYSWFCADACPPGTYFNSGGNPNRVCQECISICLQCVNADNQCTSCAYGYYLQGSTCQAACNSGFYTDKVQRKCFACNSECVECKGSLNSDCLACGNSRFLYLGICGSSCPAGFFPNNVQ